MELEDLKKDWTDMEERLGKLEMEHRELMNKTIVSKVEQVRERVLRRFLIVVFCLPFLCWFMVRHQAFNFSLLTWILMFVFVAVITARQITWWWLLKSIDCLKMTVRDVCLTENRFRMSFKIGIAVSVVCAIPLLASMMWDMSKAGDQYVLIGMWTGLFVGLLIGIRLFFRAWRGVKELREAIADLK